MRLPPPKDWQEFETMVLAAQQQRWKSPRLQKVGRGGQAQAGVDIYGPDDIGRMVGIQCKLTSHLTIKTVLAEIVKVEKDFQGRLSALFIATTSDHDARLQQEVRVLSEQRVASDRFAVGLLFWEEIVAALALNPEVMASFYPQWRLLEEPAVDRDRLLASLELGYYGCYVWEYVWLILGEIGQMVGEDPDTVTVVLRIIEQRSSQLLSRPDAEAILKSTARIQAVCRSASPTREDWAMAQMHAKRIGARVRASGSLLRVQEGSALQSGILLGRIYHHCDDRPTKKVQDEVSRHLRGVLPKSSWPAVDAALRQAARVTSGLKWATRLVTCLDREIRWAAF